MRLYRLYHSSLSRELTVFHLENSFLNTDASTLKTVSGWGNQMGTEIFTLLIPHHPNGEIIIHIIEPCPEGIGIGPHGETVLRLRWALPRGIVPAIGAVRVRNAAGRRAVPGEIRTVLPERAAQSLRFGRIHPGIGAFVKIVKAEAMGMGDDVIVRKKNRFRICHQKFRHYLSNFFKGCFRMPERSFIPPQALKTC